MHSERSDSTNLPRTSTTSSFNQKLQIFRRQTSALIKKNYIIFGRKWFSTLQRAFVIPLVLMVLLVYFGSGTLMTGDLGAHGQSEMSPTINLKTALDGSIIVFVRGWLNETADVYIDRVILREGLTTSDYEIWDDIKPLTRLCATNSGGDSNCHSVVVFRDPSTTMMAIVPSEFRYEILIPESAGLGDIDIAKHESNFETHVVPVQMAIDRALFPELLELDWNIQLSAADKLHHEVVKEWHRIESVRMVGQYLYIIIFLAMAGILYHLPGMMAGERGAGLSSLLQAHGCSQLARILSWSLTMCSLYLPSWIIGGILYSVYFFQFTNPATIILGLQLLGGLALAGYAEFLASFFSRPQLAGVFSIVLSCVLAMVALVFTTGSLYILIDLTGNGYSALVHVVCSLFPPINYCLFIYSLAEFEVLQGRNIEHASLETTSAARGLSPGALIHIFRMHPLPVKGSISLILFAIHAIIFPFLAAFIERWLYNTTDLKKRFALQSTDADVGEMAVRVSGLVQRYRKVAAVDHLDLTVYKGQLLGLLGSNGSGKTTTLQAIAGIGRMTAGTVEIADLGRSTTMNSGVGICPQSNVLWDLLTVEQHVKFWSNIKCGTRSDVNTENEIITQCDLVKKRKFLSKNLSGGQKRKLQLAIMFVGDANVCCLDEVSCGLDPLSRAKIHDIILFYRGKRTMIFTTHFLDEAESLADHIVMIAKGRSQCEGSPASLKEQYGNGYQIRSSDDATNSYTVETSEEVVPLLKTLESQNDTDYEVIPPSLEHAFLNINRSFGPLSPAAMELGSLEEIRIDVDAAHKASRAILGDLWAVYIKRCQMFLGGILPVILSLTVPLVIVVLGKFLFINRGYMATCSDIAPSREWYPEDMELELLQAVDINYHNPIRFRSFDQDLSSLSTYLLRETAAGELEPYFIFPNNEGPGNWNGQDWINSPYWIDAQGQDYFDSPGDVLSPLLILAPSEFWNSTQNRVAITYALNVANSMISQTVYNYSTQADLEEFKAAHTDMLSSGRGGLGLYFSPENKKAAISVDLDSLNNAGQLASSYPVNLIHNLMLNTSMSAARKLETNTLYITSYTTSASISLTYADISPVLYVLLFCISLSIATAFTSLYPTRERVSKVRQLHYANGVRPAALWAAHLLYEATFLALVGSLCLVIHSFYIHYDGAYDGGFQYLVDERWYKTGHFFIVIVLFAISGTLASFLASLFTSSTLASFPVVAALHVLSLVLYFGLITGLALVGRAIDLQASMRIIFFVLGFIFPAVNLARGLMLNTNMVGVACDPSKLDIRSSPAEVFEKGPEGIWDGFTENGGAMTAYGGPIFLLIIQGALCFTFLIWWDSGRPSILKALQQLFTRGAGSEWNEISESIPEPYPISVRNLCKEYGSKRFKALQNLNFMVAEAETLCLLGPNGAGKTTTLSILLGDLRATSGEVYRSKKLGFCPQFDALDNLTVLSTLQFYCRTKKVPSSRIPKIVAAVGLDDFIQRRANQLSGGNRRKLSLAIALLGNPEVLLLDEPSSGMDVASMRDMWRCIRNIRQERAVLVTTHSMEEAEALADRIGIMGRKMLATGTTRELKEAYPGDWRVRIDCGDSEKAKNWVRKVFGVDVSKQPKGVLRFKAERERFTIRQLYQVLEMAKEDGEGVLYYEIRAPGLQDVFLEIGQAYDEDENARWARLNGNSEDIEMKEIRVER